MTNTKQIVILVLATLSACAGKNLVVGPEFKAHLKRFEEAAVDQGKPVVIDNLIIRFGDPTLAGKIPNAIAVCQHDKGRTYENAWNTPVIIIDEEVWFEYESDLRRDMLLFHELGHCVLDRAHLNARANTGEPATIMYPYEFYVDQQSPIDLYVRELFASDHSLAALEDLWTGVFDAIFVNPLKANALVDSDDVRLEW